MDYLERLKKKRPMVHCITNTVTVNDCANAVLAVGARPVMAEHPRETAVITARSDALLINLGSLTDSKIKAMRASVKSAKANNIPFALDCVGVSSSPVRLETARSLIAMHTPSVIKGNASEIAALCEGQFSSGGVDAVCAPDKTEATELAKKTGAVVAVTGETDIITNGSGVTLVKNGCKMLPRITGTGCMLGCLTAALLTVSSAFSAAVYAAAVMGICGEAAADGCAGTGSFHVRLMDCLSTVTDKDISEKINLG